MAALWPVWFSKRTVPALRVRKGYPLCVQSPASVRQLAVGFGHSVDCQLSAVTDVFECIEVPTRVLALQAIREQWSKRQLLEACGLKTGGAPAREVAVA